VVRAHAATVGVHGQRAARIDAPRLDEGARLPWSTETEALQAEDRGDGEGVVDLRHVDVSGLDTGHGVGTGGGDAGDVGEVRDPVGVPTAGVRDGLAESEHVDRLLTEVPCSLRCREHDRAAAVGDDTAFEPVHRRCDHRRSKDVVDRDGLAPECVGVQRCVLAGSHGHRCRLLRRQAVLVHLALHEHADIADDRRAVGLHERVGEGHRRPSDEVAEVPRPDLHCLRASARAVTDDGRLDQPGVDRHDRPVEEEPERGAADVGLVDELRPEVQVVTQHRRGRLAHVPGLGRGRDGEEGIDVGSPEAGVVHGTDDRFRLHQPLGLLRGDAEWVLIGADDRGAPAQAAHVLQPGCSVGCASMAHTLL
jgi:hypothetical protein